MGNRGTLRYTGISRYSPVYRNIAELSGMPEYRGTFRYTGISRYSPVYRNIAVRSRSGGVYHIAMDCIDANRFGLTYLDIIFTEIKMK